MANKTDELMQKFADKWGKNLWAYTDEDNREFLHPASPIMLTELKALIKQVEEEKSKKDCESFTKNLAAHDDDNDKIIIVKKGVLDEYVNLVINRVIEGRMPTEKEIIVEGRKRFTTNTGVLQSEKYRGFISGFKFTRSCIKRK